jgi:serine/threonine protein kinase
MRILLPVLAARAAANFPVPGESKVHFHGAEYSIDKYLDNGSSSRIYAASKRSGPSGLPEDVAVKVLCPKTEDYLKHIDQEVIALNKLNRLHSDNLVHLVASSDVLDTQATPRCRLLVLSRTGLDFDRFVGGTYDFNSPVLEGVDPKVEKKISLEIFAASVGMLLADTLQMLHDAGVTHGDIYNYNVALSYPLGEQPVLIDFGGAYLRESLSSEDFKTKCRQDVRQLTNFVAGIIVHRIVRDYGKELREPMKEKSPFVRLVAHVDDLTTLRGKLMAYMTQTLGEDFDNIDTSRIVYKAF